MFSHRFTWTRYTIRLDAAQLQLGIPRWKIAKAIDLNVFQRCFQVHELKRSSSDRREFPQLLEFDWCGTCLFAGSNLTQFLKQPPKENEL